MNRPNPRGSRAPLARLELGGCPCPYGIGSGGPIELDVDIVELALDGPGGVVDVFVDAVRWNDELATANGFQSRTQLELVRALQVEVPLVPNAVNRITVARRGSLEMPETFVIACRSPIDIVPLLFDPDAPPPITQRDLDEELQRMIEEAKKLDSEIGAYLDTVEFATIEDSSTGLIDQRSPRTRENVRIRLSRMQWLRALLDIRNAATDAEAARLREEATIQFISQLLHEGNHRKGIVEDTSNDTTIGEENRNTTELMKRLLEVARAVVGRCEVPPPDPLPPLPPRTDIGGGDAVQWFDRVREIMRRQKKYRWRRVAQNKAGSKPRFDRVMTRWDRFQQDLARLRNDATKTDEEKRTAADELQRHFDDDTRADRTWLEDKYDVRWHQGHDEHLNPMDTLDCDGTLETEPIPERVH